MLRYDRKEKTLYAEKVKNLDVRLDVLDDMLIAHKKYLEEGIHEDVAFLQDVIRQKLKFDELELSAEVTSLRNTAILGKHYVVRLKAKNGGKELPSLQLMNIPYMDDLAKLNIHNKRKVIVNEQRPGNGITWDSKKNCLYVTMPKANVTFSASSRGIKMKYKQGSWIPLETVVNAMLYKEGIDARLCEVLRMYYFSVTVNQNPYRLLETDYRAVEKLQILDKFKSPNYRLGPTREFLNEALSLYAAVGETLAEPAGTFPVGTLITESVVKSLYRQHVNVVFVEDVPHIDGKYLNDDIVITEIPKGTPMCEFLEELFPEWAGLSAIPQDVYGEPLNPLYVFLTTVPLKQKDLIFLKNIGYKELSCRNSKAKTKSSKAVTYFFVREILGNYTAKLKDLVDKIPDGRYADEWVYYYNNPNFEATECPYLNPHDMVAIMSLMGRIYTTGLCDLYNRDADFIKRVMLVDDIFSEHFRKVATSFVFEYKDPITKWCVSSVQDNPFRGFTKKWIRSMQDAKVLAAADTVNAIAEVSQVSHISTIVKKDSAPEEARLLAIPSIGRLCSYETPAGKNLGLTNTKAVGAIVIDGELKAPYRRVIPVSNGIRISNEIEYLSVRDEMSVRIGDILSLRKDENGNYINNKVIARIPNPEPEGDRVIFDEINAFDLKYVNAHTEQHLSPSICLMPYACADDAVRVSYGSNMVRQAIYILHSQKPMVRTFMYRKLCDWSNTFCVRAERNGTVLAIDYDTIELLYDGDTDATVIDFEECRIMLKSVVFLNFKVCVGERFEAGQVLVNSNASVEGYYSPARNALVAYISTGYNYEDALECSFRNSLNYTSLSTTCVERRTPTTAVVGVAASNLFKYVGEGETITELSSVVADAPVTEVQKIKTEDESGLFYKVEYEEEHKTRKVKCHLLSFNRLCTGDKMSGRHGNKGVISKVTPNSLMPMLKNGMIIDIIPNQHGVPSRMNVGQIFEVHSGLIAGVTGIDFNTDPFNGASLEELQRLMSYTYDMANSKSKEEAASVIVNYPDIPTEYHEDVLDNWDNVHQWAGVFDRYGDAEIWDPQTNTWFEDKITIGYSYYMKLEHEADHKIHERSGMLEERYSYISKQPPKGASNGGGQKMGEMELCALASYGATAILNEVLNVKSDNVGARANAHLEAIGYEARVPREYCVSRAVESLVYMVEALGVHMDFDDCEEIGNFDTKSSIEKFTYDVNYILRQKKKEAEKNENEEAARNAEAFKRMRNKS